jgi:hypothetical protein
MRRERAVGILLDVSPYVTEAVAIGIVVVVGGWLVARK